jgi:hypothetical protein
MISSAKPRPQVADRLVCEVDVCVEFGISAMCAYRWDRDPKMIAQGWPVAVKINRRKFRSRSALDLFKAKLVEQAIADRNTAVRKGAEAAV